MVYMQRKNLANAFFSQVTFLVGRIIQGPYGHGRVVEGIPVTTHVTDMFRM